MSTHQETFSVGGIPINIFSSNKESAYTSTEVFVLFFLHGRMEDSKARQYVVEDLFAQLPTLKEGKRELLVVTFV